MAITDILQDFIWHQVLLALATRGANEPILRIYTSLAAILQAIRVNFTLSRSNSIHWNTRQYQLLVSCFRLVLLLHIANTFVDEGNYRLFIMVLG